MRLHAVLLVVAAVTFAGCAAKAPDGSVSSATPAAGEAPSAEPAPILGSADASVTLLAFESPACSGCRHFHLGASEGQGLFDRIQATYVANGSVKYLARTFYIGYPWEGAAANAQRCAAEEKGSAAFLNLTTRMYREQPALHRDGKALQPLLRDFATKEGLPVDAFLACANGKRHEAAIQADIREANTLGVRGTPAFFVVDRAGTVEPVRAVSFEAFSRAFDRALGESKA